MSPRTGRTLRRLRRAAALVALTLLMSMVGAVFSAPVALAEEEVVITARAFSYSPASIEIETGTTVIWRNEDPMDYPLLDGTHRVKAGDDSFDSGDIHPGQQFTKTFLEPGTIEYACVIHPSLMTGSIKVTGEPIREVTEVEVSIVEPDQTDLDTWGYRPDDLKIDAGTTVVWRNNGSSEHTVTADDETFDSRALQPGETFTYTFDDPVSLRYHCDPHPWMKGLVRVAGAGGRPPPPPPSIEEETGTGTGSLPVPQERSGDGPMSFDVQIVEPSPSDPQSWGYAPSELTARVGDTVAWTNTGSTQHTATGDGGEFDSGNLDPGGTYSFTLQDEGTLVFHCEPHPWMTGTIVVRAAGSPAPPPPEEQAGGASSQDGAGRDATGDTGAEDPAEEQDPTAVARRNVATATALAIAVLGAALAAPAIIEIRRRRKHLLQPSAPIPTEPEPERELVGASHD
jgi:plastocyanin